MRRNDPKFASHMWTPNDYASLASLERQLRLYVAKLRTMLESLRQQVPLPPPPDCIAWTLGWRACGHSGSHSGSPAAWVSPHQHPPTDFWGRLIYLVAMSTTIGCLAITSV